MATLTVGDITPRAQYTASSGQTVFAYAFPIFADGDLKVFIGSTLQTLTTHYTVSGAATSSGGNVTLVTGATLNDIVTIYRDLPVSRTSDYQTSGDLLAETLNDDLDKVVMMAQQNESSIARSIRQAITDSAVDMELPTVSGRASKLLGFDSAGDVTVSTSTVSEIDGVVAASNAAGVVATTHQFTGDGAQVAFTPSISADIPSTQSVIIDIDGVTQHTDTYTVSGKVVTFGVAPPLNGDIQIRIQSFVSSANDASAVTYSQGGTGSVSRTVENKLQESVSVKDFGAVGDGVTDDTAAFTSVEALSNDFIQLPKGTYKVDAINLKKTYIGDGVIKLNGTNQPQILSNIKPNTVLVFPPVTNTSNVLKPDGTWIDTSSSTTSGLQEAIDYSCGNGTVGSGDYDLYIVGAESSTGGAVVYNCSTAVIFPPIQGKKLASGAVTISFTSAIGTNACVNFNSCMMVDVDFAGMQIVNGGTGRTLSFNPTLPVPLDGITTIIDSSFHITTVVNINNSVQASGAGACVYFQGSTGGIDYNSFVFEEINQQNTAATSAGIWVDNPGSGFANNTVKCLHNHNFTGVGLQIGTTTGITNYGSTTWDMVFDASAGASECVNTFGDEDIFNITSVNTNAAYAIRLQASATKNTFFTNALTAGTAAVSNTATDKTSNKLIRSASIASPTALTLTGSPFVHQNTSLEEEIVNVQAGTTTANTMLSHDGTTYYDTGMAKGQFNVPRGTYLRVTYSSAPNMRVYTI